MSAFGNVAEEGNANAAFPFGCQSYRLPPMEGGDAKATSFPFTNAQWSELERQAMIYKYLVSAVPVPPSLLFPRCITFGGSEAAQVMGTPCAGDSDRGRCKRTDGKKWRCSKDAAPDQKYCERHLHRGRPRSRKPVEILPNDSAKKTRLLNSSPVIPNSQPPFIGSSFPQIQNPNVIKEQIQPRMESCWITTDQVSFEDNLLRQYGECFFKGGMGAEDVCDLPSCSWAATPDTPGGPLAEVLHGSSSSNAENLNVGESVTAASSPSGVLQKSMFSFSDSSGSSSPIPISNTSDMALMWLDQSRVNLASFL